MIKVETWTMDQMINFQTLEYMFQALRKEFCIFYLICETLLSNILLVNSREQFIIVEQRVQTGWICGRFEKTERHRRTHTERERERTEQPMKRSLAHALVLLCTDRGRSRRRGCVCDVCGECVRLSVSVGERERGSEAVCA